MGSVLSWPLRLRVGLLFALLALGAWSALGLGLWVAARLLDTATHPAAVEALVVAGLIGGFGIAGVTVGLWWLFDANLARPMQRLSGALRAQAAGGKGQLDHASLRFLGDLSGASEAITKRLSASQLDAAADLARATQALAEDRARLASILSDIPLGVMMLDENRRITIYDVQCQEAFGAETPLVLGRDAAQYFAPDRLEAALDALSRLDGSETLRTPLPLARDGLVLEATLRRLGDGSGVLLTFEVDVKGLPARPIVFDFSPVSEPPTEAMAQTRLTDLAYVVFDTETTGLDPKHDDVVQIGAVRMHGTRIIDGERFDTLVDPGRPIPAPSTRIHGIGDGDVVGAPSFAEAGARFCHFAGQAVIVAHNAPFDLAFFDRHSEAIGASLDAPVLDTVLLSAALFGGDEAHSLDALAERFGVEIDPALRHTALGDAIATAEVLGHMIRFAEERGITTLADAMAAMKSHARLLPDVLARPANQRVRSSAL